MKRHTAWLQIPPLEPQHYPALFYNDVFFIQFFCLLIVLNVLGWFYQWGPYNAFEQ